MALRIYAIDFISRSIRIRGSIRQDLLMNERIIKMWKQKCEMKFSHENFYYIFFTYENVQIWILQIYVNLSEQPFRPRSGSFSRRALIVIFVPGTRPIVGLRLHGSNVNT